MLAYNVTVPTFTYSPRVQFAATIQSILTTFVAEWFDDLWHLNITRNGELRSCTLHPNAVYFAGDKQWLLSPIFDGDSIGQNDLSGMTIQVGVSE
jgi:hypothetical protein